MPDDPLDSSPSHDERVDEAVADFLQRIDAGEKVDLETSLAEYSDLREELKEFLTDRQAVNRLVATLVKRQDGERVFIVQEYIPGDDLASHLASHSPTPERIAELVVCVRLTVFAEMKKGRAWTPGTLQPTTNMAG